ncbi:MAG: efflux RND transporter periplasmic adaptor subunit [Saprospiraceae bacterium]|nr:efflux RND transporter periplasmic adaptor subunit [Saprospiraceae bacterium]
MRNIVFLIAILAIVACGKNEKSAQSNTTTTEEKKPIEGIVLTTDQLKLMNIELGNPEKRAFVGNIVANGKVTVLANDMADISAPLRGTVVKINAHEGQFVKKGMILMELTSPDIINLQREYLVAQSELVFLEKEWERQQTMAKENVGASRNEQEVRSKVMMQKAILKTTASKLRLADIPTPQYDGEIMEKIRIIAPISGYIDHFPVSIGTTAMEGAKLAHIKSFDDPHADIAIYERDLQKIRAGQAVRLRFADPSVPETVGHVEYIGRDISPETKTVTLHVPFKAPAGKTIATDMLVTALIESSGTQQMTALPESAVVQDEGKFYYFLMEKNDDKSLTFKKIEFTPLSMTQGWVAVEASLLGKQFVVKGANVLLSESKKEEVE